MKKIILAFFFVLSSLPSFAQTAPTSKLTGAATSQEEYNYATKGLKTQRAQGLDMKAGYELINNITTPAAGGATISIEDLIRKSDQTLACIIVQISSPKMSEPLYLAIPNPASPGGIFSQYAKAVNELEPLLAKNVLYYVSTRLSAMESVVVKMAK